MAINKFVCDSCGKNAYSYKDCMRDTLCPCGIYPFRMVWVWDGPTTDEEFKAIYEINAKEKALKKK